MDSKNRDIVKSNALIKACYSPGSIYQMRLLMAALMQIKSSEPLDYRQRFYVRADELAAILGTPGANNYRELRQAANDLLNATVTLHENADGTLLQNGDYTKVHFVSSCEYKEKSGCVGIRFTEEIAPYVSALRGRFTKYDPLNVIQMRSAYGVRIYELCVNTLGQGRKELVIELDEFRKMFDLVKKYPIVTELKRNVIAPALRDINKHSDLNVTFEQIKIGARVAKLKFTIDDSKRSKSLEKPAKKTPSLDHDTWLQRYDLGRIGELADAARKRTYGEYMKYKKDPASYTPPPPPPSQYD